MNQVHYIDNQFNLNFQPISLYIVNNYMIWYPYLQLHKINFINCMTLFHKERYMMYKIFLITPSSTNILLNLSYQTLDHVPNACFQINYSVKPSMKTMFKGSQQQPDVVVTRPRELDVAQLGTALQTHFALYSCGQHNSSYNQIHNHITLSNP
jgi:hypothetical protein